MFHNRDELVQYLIKNGADFRKENKRKKTAKDLATIMGHDKIVSMMA